jgi:hypothetical protein
MMSRATCRFCACPDDTIQVICDNRCLICSRCQGVPALRRLLIDHTLAVDVTAPIPILSTLQPTRTILKGYCPVCAQAMSATMLAQIASYKELYRMVTEDDKTVRMSDVGCRMSDVECRMSYVVCRMSYVVCRMS